MEQETLKGKDNLIVNSNMEETVSTINTSTLNTEHLQNQGVTKISFPLIFLRFIYVVIMILLLPIFYLSLALLSDSGHIGGDAFFVIGGFILSFFVLLLAVAAISNPVLRHKDVRTLFIVLPIFFGVVIYFWKDFVFLFSLI